MNNSDNGKRMGALFYNPDKKMEEVRSAVAPRFSNWQDSDDWERGFNEGWLVAEAEQQKSKDKWTNLWPQQQPRQGITMWDGIRGGCGCLMVPVLILFVLSLLTL